MATILENVYTLSAHLEDAYTALEGKGATIPQQKNAANLSATVDSVPAGGGISIDGLLGGQQSDPIDLVVSLSSIPSPTYTTTVDSSSYERFGSGYNLFGYRSNANVRSIDFPNLTSIGAYALMQMFRDNTTIQECKSLPAATIQPFACKGMFYNCTNLVKAPDLTATTLAIEAYRDMFNGCTALAVAPKMASSVNSFGQFTYANMFMGTSITSFPQGFDEPVYPAANTYANGAFTGMFRNCSRLSGTLHLKIANTTGETGLNVFNRMCQDCPNVEKVILDFTRNTAVPQLYNANVVNVFYNTSDTRLEIRVPASLEASWKTASNWSTYANMIVGV